MDPGLPQHCGSSHGRISLTPVSHPQSGYPQYPRTLCALVPRLLLATRWHGVPVTLGTQAVQPGMEGLADRGTSPTHQPLPSASLQVRRPKFVQAQFDFSAHDGSQLPFLRGDIIEVLDYPDPNWWQGKIYGRVGLFPRNYVHPIHK